MDEAIAAGKIELPYSKPRDEEEVATQDEEQRKIYPTETVDAVAPESS